VADNLCCLILRGLALVLGKLLVLACTSILPVVTLIGGSLVCIEVTDRFPPDFMTLDVIRLTVVSSGTFAVDDKLILVVTFLEELDRFLFLPVVDLILDISMSILPSRVVDRFEEALVLVSLKVNKLEVKSLTGFSSIRVLEFTIFVEDFAVGDLDTVLIFAKVDPGDNFEIVVKLIVRGSLVEIVSGRELIFIDEVVGSLF